MAEGLRKHFPEEMDIQNEPELVRWREGSGGRKGLGWGRAQSVTLPTVRLG